MSTQPSASWRSVAVLSVVPLVFALMALGFAASAVRTHLASVPGEGTVVKVYEYEDSAPWRRGAPVFAPVFAYTWSDGAQTVATPGQSHKDWNFAEGSVHPIRYLSERKGDVILPGSHNWMPALAMAALALITALPALIVWRRLRRG